MSQHRSSRSTAATKGSSRRPAWIPAALCALLALTAAWLVLPGNVTEGADNADPAESDSAQPSALGQPGASTTWVPTTPDPEVAAPSAGPTGRTAVSVSIPSIGVDSALVGLGVDPTTGGLVPPRRYEIAGVFTDGPLPGDPGPAVIAGHVDSRTGPAVFYRLEEVIIGEAISVALSDGQRIEFRVVEVAQYPKTAFPTAEVYGPIPGRELRLITCGGDFDPSRRSYRDNIVVYAVRV